MGRPVIPIASLTRRLPELGRIKDGVKGPEKVSKNGNKYREPSAIDTLRFTSQDPKALAQVAAELGGEVVAYSDPKSTDTHELITPAIETRVILPPDPLGGTPIYEEYTKGGRESCDGVTRECWRKGPDGPEPFDEPCRCFAAGNLTCKPTVHLSVILPFTRLGGTWRWTTHSHNAAQELPAMVDAIQSMQAKGLTRGVLRVDSRTQTIAGVTRHFKVPVLGVDATADELASGQATFGALSAGAPTPIAAAAVGEIEAGGTPTPREPHGAADPPASVSPPPENDIVDAEIVDDDDTLDLLRRAIEGTPRMTEARAVKRARDIAQEMGLQKLPTDFESLPKFPAVLAALAAELVEAAA